MGRRKRGKSGKKAASSRGRAPRPSLDDQTTDPFMVPWIAEAATAPPSPAARLLAWAAAAWATLLPLRVALTRAARRTARAAGRALVTATRVTGRALIIAACTVGRGLVTAARALATTDWRRVAARARTAAIDAGSRAVDIGRATGRALLTTARVLAVVVMTLVPATLFVGAVLLGAGYEPGEGGRSTGAVRVASAGDAEAEARPRARARASAVGGARTAVDANANIDANAKTDASANANIDARADANIDASANANIDARADADVDVRASASARADADVDARTSARADAMADATAVRGAHRTDTLPPKAPSCSAGTRVTGPLLQPARLPDEGPGFARHFPHRDLAYATDELVGALVRTAAALNDPNLPPMMIGNLSGPKGDQAGADPFHPARYSRGHGAGRAADLLFFVTDALGRPAPAVESNLSFDASGRSEAGVRRVYLEATEALPDGCHLSRRRGDLVEAACPVPAGAWRIDFDRTWQLVRALLTDPEIGVVDPETGISREDGHGIRFIFVAEAIEARLLDAARNAGEPEAFLEIAGILLHPPSNAAAYDRFLHVDLWCTDADRRACACDDGAGPWNRWRAGARVLPPAGQGPYRPDGLRLTAAGSDG
jgi:hypothetical protein